MLTYICALEHIGPSIFIAHIRHITTVLDLQTFIHIIFLMVSIQHYKLLICSWVRETLSRRQSQSNGAELGGRVRLKTGDLWVRRQVHRYGRRVRVRVFCRVHEEQTRGVTSVWRLVILCVNNTLVPARTLMLSEIAFNFQRDFRLCLFYVSFSCRHQRVHATGNLQQWAV